ncbi:MAG: bifunctional glutamate N-acetyltransferase/amino-acid acetyltransferase ArgJ [Chloroflexota bacterium]
MPELVTSISGVAGFSVAGVHAGLKKDGALDLALIVSDSDCVAAGVFTKNRIKAAPVLVNQEHLSKYPDQIRAVAVNTVSANAATGEQGMENSRKMAEIVAESIGSKPEQVFVMSTGVIGTQLPIDQIEAGIRDAHTNLGNGWHNAANAIRTTDQFEKWASIQVETDTGSYTIAGLTKGAGMIAPNMATMLGIIVTDLKISPKLAQKALNDASNLSYNRIVVDGDTSTNDMVVLLANGKSDIEIDSQVAFKQFLDALTQLTTYLAQQVVRDGEGATKFITVNIHGAKNIDDAEKIAHTIASSALVKTAFYGNDANWGRIVAAAGRAGVEFDASQLSLTMNPSINESRCILLFENGAKADYDENEATAIISHDEVTITLNLNTGSSKTTVWTCDFTHDYVSINADYRT